MFQWGCLPQANCCGEGGAPRGRGEGGPLGEGGGGAPRERGGGGGLGKGEVAPSGKGRGALGKRGGGGGGGGGGKW